MNELLKAEFDYNKWNYISLPFLISGICLYQFWTERGNTAFLAVLIPFVMINNSIILRSTEKRDRLFAGLPVSRFAAGISRLAQIYVPLGGAVFLYLLIVGAAPRGWEVEYTGMFAFFVIFVCLSQVLLILYDLFGSKSFQYFTRTVTVVLGVLFLAGMVVFLLAEQSGFDIKPYAGPALDCIALIFTPGGLITVGTAGLVLSAAGLYTYAKRKSFV